MQSSQAPHIEIATAKQAIESMREAESLDDSDQNWKLFLHRLERIWSKTLAHYRRSPKWGNWAAKFDRDRKSDMLLSYLCQARGAEEHTTTEVTGNEPGSVDINLADGVGVQSDGSVLIEDLSFVSGPDGTRIFSAQPLKLTFVPARVRIEPVVNRGRTYAVPHTHLGKAVDPTNLIFIANLALQYYEAVVAKAEEHFVK